MVYNNYCDNIFSNKSLPGREQKDLFIKLRNGESDCRSELICKNARLVYFIVYKKYLYSGYEIDDLISIGTLGLIKAVDTYDVNKNVMFSSYALRCIENEILMTFRKCSKEDLNLSLDNTYSDKDGSEYSLLDTLSDESIDVEDDYNEKETILELRKIIEELPSRDKLIVSLYFGFIDDKRYTQKEIAEIIDVSQVQVARLLKKNLEKLRVRIIRECSFEKSSSSFMVNVRK